MEMPKTGLHSSREPLWEGYPHPDPVEASKARQPQAIESAKPVVLSVIDALDGPMTPGRVVMPGRVVKKGGLEVRFRRDLNFRLGGECLEMVYKAMPSVVGDLVRAVVFEIHGAMACPTVADVVSARRVVAAMLDPVSADDLADRIDGKPTQKLEIMSDVKVSVGLPVDLRMLVEE